MKQAGWSEDHGLLEEKHRKYFFLMQLLEGGVRGVSLYVTHPHGMQYIHKKLQVSMMNMSGVMGRTISEIGRTD